MCSAVGQGALAIETRASGAGFDAVQAMDHADTHAAVMAERGVLGALGGGCQVPIGAHATVEGGRLQLLGVVASPDGDEVIRGVASGASSQAESSGDHGEPIAQYFQVGDYLVPTICLPTRMAMATP